MPSVEMLVLHLLDFECIRLAIGGLACSSRSHHFYSCRSAGGQPPPRRIPFVWSGGGLPPASSATSLTSTRARSPLSTRPLNLENNIFALGRVRVELQYVRGAARAAPTSYQLSFSECRVLSSHSLGPRDRLITHFTHLARVRRLRVARRSTIPADLVSSQTTETRGSYYSHDRT